MGISSTGTWRCRFQFISDHYHYNWTDGSINANGSARIYNAWRISNDWNDDWNDDWSDEPECLYPGY